jgi:cell division septation protein DedD
MGLAALAAAVSLAIAVPGAQAAGEPANSQASEMVRLINGVRSVEGRAALRVDPYLARLASDGAIACPDDASKTIAGRAKDFATYDYMSHKLRLCNSPALTLSTVSFVTTMGSSYGYSTVGEDLLVNGGYGTGKYLTTYKTWSSWSYATTGHGILGWMSSSTHRAIILGSYDRVGCGAWRVGGKFWYACLFSKGGASPSGTVAPPTTPSFPDPVPTPAATPVPPKPPAPTPRPTRATSRTTPRPAGTAVASDSADPTAEASPRPSQTAPAPSTTPIGGSQVVGAASAAPWAGGPASVDMTPDGGGYAWTPAVARLAGVLSGALAVLLATSYGALLMTRRRRLRNPGPG